MVGTLAHEDAHTITPRKGGKVENEDETAAREVETEAVTYVVGRHFGLDMDGSACVCAPFGFSA